MAPQRRRCIVTAKQSDVKRYEVRLSDEERERLDALTHMGKHPARLLTKARILLKAVPPSSDPQLKIRLIGEVRRSDEAVEPKRARQRSRKRAQPDLGV
jgi:predicted DNA-binding protein